MKRLLKIALPLAAVAAVVAWWQFAWSPSGLENAVRNEPLELTAMDHVRRALFDPTAKFYGVRYFAATKAACGEVLWSSNTVHPAGRSFFVAYLGGYVRFALDTPAAEFMALVERSCPDKEMLRAAARAASAAQPGASGTRRP